MRCRLTRVLVVLVLAIVACVAGWVWRATRDYGPVFLRQKGNLLETSTGPGRQALLTSDTGLKVAVRWSGPADASRVPGVLLAADYGWEGDFDVRTLGSTWRSVRQLKTVTDEVVPRLLLALDFLAPRRLTFIASRTDPQFPVAAVENVYARAGQTKALVWHDTPHVAPDAAEIIAELSRVVIEELAAETK